jgi:hypothetical protein
MPRVDATEWDVQAMASRPVGFSRRCALKKHSVLLATALALSLASLGASARETLIWCNGCTEQQEARAAATALNKENTNPTAPVQGAIYVGNNEVVHKYFVYVGNQAGPSPCASPACRHLQGATAANGLSGNGNNALPRWTATPMLVESHVQTAFDDMRAFYHTPPVGWTKSFTVKIMKPSKAMDHERR